MKKMLQKNDIVDFKQEQFIAFPLCAFDLGDLLTVV
jgi:hypothetical protein